MKKEFVILASILLLGVFFSSCGGAKDPEAILGDISYSEYEISGGIVVSVPEVLEVEDWRTYLIVKKEDCFKMYISAGAYTIYTTEGTWESVKKFYETLYSNTKSYAVAGIEGIMADQGAGISMLFPLDEENLLTIDLPGLGNDAKKRTEIFESPEVQVVLKKLKIK